MQFDGNPQIPGCLENAFRLGQTESDSFTEGINCVRQSLLGYLLHHFRADQIDVSVTPSLKFPGKCMGAQKTGGNMDRKFPSKPSCHLEHSAFGLDFQSITGFDFNSGHSFREQRLHT